MGGFFNEVRNLQSILQSLGTNKEKTDHVLRYCMLSGRLMHYEMRRDALPKAERARAKEEMWDELMHRTSEFGKLLPEERDQLDTVEDASGMIFTWIMSYLGRMSQDGELPEFKSGVYGRVAHYAVDAKGALEKSKAIIGVQMPFVYVHTVATIVQVNNLLSAV